MSGRTAVSRNREHRESESSKTWTREGEKSRAATGGHVALVKPAASRRSGASPPRSPRVEGRSLCRSLHHEEHEEHEGEKQKPLRATMPQNLPSRRRISVAALPLRALRALRGEDLCFLLARPCNVFRFGAWPSVRFSTPVRCRAPSASERSLTHADAACGRLIHKPIVRRPGIASRRARQRSNPQEPTP